MPGDISYAGKLSNRFETKSYIIVFKSCFNIMKSVY